MKDLAQLHYERSEHYFDRLHVVQMVLNPKTISYPEVFLICTEKKGDQDLEYAIGLKLSEWNTILMKAVTNDVRLTIADAMTDMYLDETTHRCETSLKELIGGDLLLRSAHFCTKLKKFCIDKPNRTKPLYYYQLVHFEPFRA